MESRMITRAVFYHIINEAEFHEIKNITLVYLCFDFPVKVKWDEPDVVASASGK